MNGKRGAWGHAIGGMGAITRAMAAAAQARGAEIRTGAKVDEECLDVIDERLLDFCLAPGIGGAEEIEEARIFKKLRGHV